jgi:hypothetical protein
VFWTWKKIVAEKIWQELAAQLPMGSEFRPAAVRYRVLAPAGGRVASIPEHPEVAWKGCGVPFARILVGKTPQPDSVTFAAGPELATVIWISSLTFAVIEKELWLAVLLASPP